MPAAPVLVLEPGNRQPPVSVVPTEIFWTNGARERSCRGHSGFPLPQIQQEGSRILLFLLHSVTSPSTHLVLGDLVGLSARITMTKWSLTALR